MATQSLPVQRLINVTFKLNPQAAQSPALNDMLVIGSSAAITIQERWRLYESLEEVGNDVGNNAPEYFAAALWFEQAPQPSRLYLGRYAPAGSAGQAIGAPLTAAQQTLANFTAIVAGGFHIGIDGNAAVEVDALNFSGAANLNAVAADITTALQALTHKATCVWDSVYSRFEITSATTGATSAITFLTAPTTGVDISSLLGLNAAQSGGFLSPGIAAETAVSAVQLFDNLLGQKWFGLTVLGASTADSLAIGTFIEGGGNYHFYGATSQDPNVLVAGNTTDLASQMAALKFSRSAVQYSSTSAYAVVSLLSRILTTDYNANNTVITLMYKQEPGIVPESLSSTQAATLEAKNCNVFAEYNNNTAIIQDGVCCAGAPVFVDTELLAINYAVDVQSTVWNRLYGANKVPQTDAGTHLIVTDIEAVSQQYVENGALAPGQWNGPPVGSILTGTQLQKGYYVYAPPVATQDQADRVSRLSVPIQVIAKLAGAIHKVNISITLDE